MRISQLKINEIYKHKTNPNVGFAKVIEILKPNKGENYNSYTIVKCEWMINKNASFGLIKYFRPRDLLPITMSAE